MGRRPVALIACTLPLACSGLLGIDDLAYHPDGGSTEAQAPDADAAGLPDASFDGCGSQTDSLNCGVCGHDCLGGACNGGVCQPFTMYAGSPLESVLATDGTSVFFRTSSEVLSCRSNQPAFCAPSNIAATSHPLPIFLSGALGHVFWNDGGVIYGCATSPSCAPTQYLDLTTIPTTLYGLGSALLANYLMAVDEDSMQSMDVWRIGLDDNNPAPTQIISYTLSGPPPNQVAVTPASKVTFWSQQTSPAALYVCAADDCLSTPSGTVSSASPLVLLATPSALYVGSFAGLLVTDPALTNMPAHIAGSSQIVALAANEASTTIFYADQQGISACPASSTGTCAPQVLRSTNTPITALTADATAVYWIEGNAIMRLVL